MAIEARKETDAPAATGFQYPCSPRVKLAVNAANTRIASNPSRKTRIPVSMIAAGRLTWANHGLDDGRVVLEESLVEYLLYYQRAPDIVASFFVEAVAGPLAPGVARAYDAPFPDRTYQAGLRQMTGLIPRTRNDPGARVGRATMRALERWDRPFLTAYSDGDPATRGWETVFQQEIPGARDQQHVTIEGAGHFVQERKGAELAAVIDRFIGD